MKLGIIGCGNISDAYFSGSISAKNISIIACSDINNDTAIKKAEMYDIEALNISELLSNNEIELIINITNPQSHKEVTLSILNSGKHAYSEKPLALSVSDGLEIIKASKDTGYRIGCAPDTFLGSGIQSTIKGLNEHKIGNIFGGSVMFLCPGHESWHPNPEFYYLKGGGPVMDMAVYYITALVNMLGPVKSVLGKVTNGFEKRVCTSEERNGDILKVEVPTHSTSILEFSSGVIINMVMSFDVQNSDITPFQLWGTHGTMNVPDPNTFEGRPMIKMKDEDNWRSLNYNFAINSRIFGVVDMVRALKDNRPHRANGDLALHVLETMIACEKSSAIGKPIKIQNICEIPKPLGLGLKKWEID
tara:strand:- start:2130 stop:3212 length:1083 start_codon:yes stop_codon:yes gene_type:complete